MNSAIHVAHVIDSLAIGGLENGVVNLANMSMPGIRHTIVCLTAAGTFRTRLEPRVDVVVVGKRPGHDAGAFVRLVRILRRLKPDVVHSRNWAAFDAVPAARLARARAVVHGEHGRDITDPEGRNNRRNRFRRVCAPLIDRFVTVSDDLQRWLVEDVRIPARKVVSICNGVDTSRFSPEGGGDPRGSLALASDDLVVGTVGRLDPVKDHSGLIRAFAGIVTARRNAMLIILGDGPGRRHLETLVSEVGLSRHVRFLGERTDVPDLLRAMDVFVLPSIAEGMSNTLLEAMATGLPVVATRVGGNAEVVDDGVNGVLVPKQNAAAVSSAIAAYLDDPHLRIVHGKASRQRAVERFGLHRMRDSYVDLYASLTGRRSWPRSA